MRFEHDILQPCTGGIVVNEGLLHAFRHRRFYRVFIFPGAINLKRREYVFIFYKQLEKKNENGMESKGDNIQMM